MEVTINGVKVESDATAISDLLTEQQISSIGIAIAVGSKIIPRAQWGDFPIEEGAIITIIRATQGG